MHRLVRRGRLITRHDSIPVMECDTTVSPVDVAATIQVNFKLR